MARSSADLAITVQGVSLEVIVSYNTCPGLLTVPVCAEAIRKDARTATRMKRQRGTGGFISPFDSGDGFV
jgi:hypothetical protein